MKKLRDSKSLEMLKAVLEGETYGRVAKRYDITRTAVERRVKLAVRIIVEGVGVEGLGPGQASYVTSLRKRRDSILIALDQFDPLKHHGNRGEILLVSNEELARGLKRIAERSTCPWRDQALFQFLFMSGARPLEVARLEVRDYLNVDGSVRRDSELRPEVAVSGKARPLQFTCSVLDDLLSSYLAERLLKQHGMGAPDAYRGLDPNSRLFLSHDGVGFKILEYGFEGQRRYLCRPILELYRKLSSHSRLQGITPLAIRHTVAARLHAQGANEGQIALLLGLSDRRAVREQFPLLKPFAQRKSAGEGVDTINP